MKQKILKCDCCGREFYTEYYTGGYIDHYENFARNFEKYNNNIEKITYEICMTHNRLRDSHDIGSRLECVLLSKDIENTCKEQIKVNVHSVLDSIYQAEEKAKNIVTGLTMLERLKLIEAAEDNCNKPYVNWESCLQQ